MTGWVGILSVELIFPGASSLKDKRMHLRSIKDQLVNRTGGSVAEVAHHDAWQRSQLLLACATREAGGAARVLDDAERWLCSGPWEVARIERRFVTPEDE